MRVYNNRVVCDLRKAQWTVFGYVNQHGQVVSKKPKFSVHGYPQDPSERAMTKCGEPSMTMKEMADHLKITDVWVPRIKIMFASNHYLVYTGQKAVSINDAWNKRIFKESKKEWSK